MSFKAVTVGLVLACAALSSSAITLGRIRGAAWIGQPFEATVAVTLEGAGADKNLCAEADVFHADTRQDSVRVRVTTEPTDQPDTVALRVSSSALVDEPVVTVYVRAGCSQRAARRYVFLAEVPDSSMAPARVVVPAQPQVSPSTQADTGTTATVNLTAPSISRVIQSRPPEVIESASETARGIRKIEKKARPPKADRPAPPAKKVNSPAPKPPDSDRPRLKLDPMDGLFERAKPEESPRPTTGTPAGIELRESDGLSELKASVKAQLAQSAQSEAHLLAMRERLEKAEAERVPLTVVYILIALLTLCIAALGYLWWKRTTSEPLTRG